MGRLKIIMREGLEKIKALKNEFEAELSAGQSTPVELLKDERLKSLFKDIQSQPAEMRQIFGQAVNDLKKFLLQSAEDFKGEVVKKSVRYLDVTAPWDLNQNRPPALFNPELGSVHPILKTQDELVGIFAKMGFGAVESRQIDNEFYMFDSLNFPPQHPARDQLDTFWLVEKDQNNRPLLAPGHTSIMQNRVLRELKSNLEKDLPIAVVIPGRVFRNEDVDPRHDHMFYQLEGIYVGRQVTAANLIATLKEAMSAYFKKELKFKLQPFYFPFTEPSFEFAISCPFCDLKKDACRVCGRSGWIELLGCGMIHPNVLSMAGIDSEQYTGFAWGLGLNRLTMLKYEIEDIRHFASGKLEFLRQFRYEN